MVCNTYDILVGEFAKALLPLQLAAQSPINAQRLLRKLGWTLPQDLTDIGFGELDLILMFQALKEVLEAENQGKQQSEMLGLYTKLSSTVGNVTFSISKLAAEISNLDGVTDDYLKKTDIVNQLAPRLLDYIVIGYVNGNSPILSAILQLLGIFQLEYYPEKTEIYQSEHIRLKIDIDVISTLLSNPEILPSRLYRWGTSDFDLKLLLIRLGRVFETFGAEAKMYKVRQAFEEQLLGCPVPESVQNPMPELHLSFLNGGVTDDLDVGLSLFGLRADAIRNPSSLGLGVAPYAYGNTELSFPILNHWKLKFESTFDIQGGVVVVLRPNKWIEIHTGLFEEERVLAASGKFLGTITYQKHNEERFTLLSLVSILHLEALQFFFGFGTELGANGGFDLIIKGGLKGGKFQFDPSGSDNFVRKILPLEGFEIDFDVFFSYSSKNGLYFEGSAALEITLPLHTSFGPIDIDSLYLCLSMAEGPLSITAALSFSGKLGPVAASVQKLGAIGDITFPSSRNGNLGIINLDLRPLPPTGAGLSIDAGGIIGGGYLEFDTQNERYAGILALSFGEIALVAIGLIATKLPSGKQTFSMLINIGVIFDPPIELSYGFTLSGVGGLIGINRTMDTEALQRGFKNGTVNSILMPDPSTVIANAAKIISDMRTVFPPEENRFVVGPMIKIGWGTPKNIITADIGIFLEIPDPFRVALMGKVRSLLPEAEKPIISIKMDILGVLDLGRKVLSFQSKIYESKILTFDLYGDTAFLLSWGANPEFALAMGGFHPKFSPPPPPYIFADLKPLSLNISYENILFLQCASYQALTPNSLQFGASLDLYASVSEASVTGHLSFDALFYFSPFSFEVSISGAVQIKAMGQTLADINLFLVLSGPQPWNARGQARVNILFFSINVDFNLTWGNPVPVIQPAIDPWPKLLEALQQSASWGATLPTGMSMVEALRPDLAETATPAGVVLVHPAGTLEVRQNVVPFDITIQKFGNAPATGHNRFRIASITAGGQAITSTTDLEEFFARGNYESLTNDQKLSLPSFEKMIGGVALSSRQIHANGTPEVKKISYEEPTSEKQNNSGAFPWPKPIIKGEVELVLAGTAAGRSLLRRSGLRKFAVSGRATYVAPRMAGTTPSNPDSQDRDVQNPVGDQTTPKVQVEEEQYCIVNAADLSLVPRSDLDFGKRYPGMTRMAADQILKTYRQQHPEQADDLLVVPSYEVAV